jgi:DNA-binding transcriptional regulator YiaG
MTPVSSIVEALLRGGASAETIVEVVRAIEATRATAEVISAAMESQNGHPSPSIGPDHSEKPVDVAALRKSLGWSQTKLAEYIGVKPPTVSRWESGIIVPSGPARHILLRILATRPETSSPRV